MTRTDKGWGAYLKSLYLSPRTLRQLPSDVVLLGIGILAAHEFDLSLTAGYITVTAGMLVLIFKAWLPLRKQAVEQPLYDIPLQAEVDEAREAGYRVWTMVPRSNDTATRALFALRHKGYLLTDQKGRLLDAAVEHLDESSMRRRAFRLVELEPPTGKSGV